MSTLFRLTNGALIALGALSLTATAAFSQPPSERAPCFFINQWEGWKAPSPDVLYLRVNMHDIYRVDLSAGSPQLQWPDAHLISVSRGSDSVCSAIDLDLAVSDMDGIKQHLIARSLTKLTPDEIAAIPKKFLP